MERHDIGLNAERLCRGDLLRRVLNSCFQNHAGFADDGVDISTLNDAEARLAPFHSFRDGLLVSILSRADNRINKRKVSHGHRFFDRVLDEPGAQA